MDDRRFDSLVKALAAGKSRRSVLKGLLGLGGVAAIGGTLRDESAEAARRPTPTPTPIRCPGNQTPVNGVCTCPASTPDKCGPDCCNPAGIGPSHSECCDNACCFGTCYGEELCCATNDRSIGGVLLPPTNRVCDTVDGLICCLFDDECCIVDGCCETVCFGGSVGADFCCPTVDFCPGGSESEDRCCTGNTTCCGGGTNANACVDLTVEGNCCVEGDCEDPFCEVCNLRTHTCGPRCNPETQVCCTDQAGPGECQDGTCCPAEPCEVEGQLCCVNEAGVATCVTTGECCTVDTDCDNGCLACVNGACIPQCTRQECCTVATDRADWFCLEEGQCCTTDDSFTCGDGCCPIEDTCCEGECCTGECLRYVEEPDVCCTTFACGEGEGRDCCPNVEDYKCCGTRGCCGNSQCNEEADVCCPSDSFACGIEEGNQCCGTETEKCCDGVCIDRSICCPSIDGECPNDCEPNCLCGDGVVDPATDGLACNGGLAAGGGVCACGWCAVPLVGCPCGCAGDTECVECDGNGGCVPINEGGTCNGGAGVCDDVWCVDPPPPSCEPNCDCSIPANNGLACNGGGGAICGCGSCNLPLPGCPCGCAGDTECVRCAAIADGTCETYNQGLSCNGGAGVCSGPSCV